MIKPLQDHILAKLRVVEKTTKAGIVIADTTQRDAAPILDVVAVGPDVIEDIKPGVTIVASNVDTMLKIEDEVLLSQADVLGIIE